jgi:hypothetical protein
MSEADIASKVAFCWSLNTCVKTACGAALLSLTRHRKVVPGTPFRYEFDLLIS